MFPPLTGVAVNVTAVPEQTGFAPAATDTRTGRFEFALIVIVFEVAGELMAQEALEVNTQVTASALFGV